MIGDSRPISLKVEADAGTVVRARPSALDLLLQSW